MSSKQRFLAALERRKPDRLPVTTHHLMQSYLDTALEGIGVQEFFDRFQLDPILWTMPTIPCESDDWRVETEDIEGQFHPTQRHRIVTPGGALTMITQSDASTTWVTEHLIKRKADIDLLAYAPPNTLDLDELNREADAFGERGMVRGGLWGFDVSGQSGCWQDAAWLYGIQELICATLEDPHWVRSFLAIIQRRKLASARSCAGARFDLIEMGGGDASSSVITAEILEEFVCPFDAPVIDALHAAGQRVVYHTCGCMMPFLDAIASMGPDAMETFTPPAMGGDADLRAAKKQIGDKVCLIGGFDQFRHFVGCTPQQTRAAVRRCFEEAGEGGGFILSPSDHFFEAEPALLHAFADEARKCIY